MLAMGRALMTNGDLVLMDEPSLGLAPLLVQTVFDIIEEFRTLGKTILLVEQNAYKALDVADRAYVLEQGTDSQRRQGQGRKGRPCRARSVFGY
jgi:branched-chain amino acid transport system ATP-binding protein